MADGPSAVSCCCCAPVPMPQQPAPLRMNATGQPCFVCASKYASCWYEATDPAGNVHFMCGGQNVKDVGHTKNRRGKNEDEGWSAWTKSVRPLGDVVPSVECSRVAHDKAGHCAPVAQVVVGVPVGATDVVMADACKTKRRDTGGVPSKPPPWDYCDFSAYLYYRPANPPEFIEVESVDDRGIVYFQVRHPKSGEVVHVTLHLSDIMPTSYEEGIAEFCDARA